jgi:hypothetical protein
MLSLEGFKEIHGIKEIKFSKTSTNRLVAINLKFKLFTKELTKIDFNQPLFVTHVTTDKDGKKYDEPFFVISNSGKLTASDVVL